MAELKLPKVYPITDPRLSGLSHSEQIGSLIEGGASLVQIRDKYASSKEFFEIVRECVEIQDVRLIVNDRVDIAMMAGADGVHLGQDDLSPTEARKLLGPDAIIGFSTHTIEQAVAALELPVDYIAFGPIFPTTTKPDHDAVVGLGTLRKIRGRIGNFPLVGIGGINLENLAAVIDAGADSVAMISALVADPSTIVKNMRKALRLGENAQNR
ncbi:MAG: thiamine phosphate synthase [Acidobacteria bacterium]|nr:MAG: thiamine phosphate synthase [Acidobacteriota bacterium]